MFSSGSKILEILREQERKARLRFWSMLVSMSGQYTLACPFTEEPPPNAILFGSMPRSMRGAFMKAYELRSAERRAEAEVFEEAISDLLQEHFKGVLAKRKERGDSAIGHFRLGKGWTVYAVPITSTI